MSVDSSDEILDSILGSNTIWGMSKSDMEAKSFDEAKVSRNKSLLQCVAVQHRYFHRFQLRRLFLCNRCHLTFDSLLPCQRDFGEPLRFGQYVNLVHVLSSKVLNKTKKVADAEPQCLEVSLGDIGIESYFRVMPQFKSRSIGDLVYVGDTIFLQCCGGFGEFYLRASPKFRIEEDEEYTKIDPTALALLKTSNASSQDSLISELATQVEKTSKDPREVNASSNPSGWVFNMFSPYNPKAGDFLTSCLPFR